MTEISKSRIPSINMFTASLLLLCIAQICDGTRLFSSLPRSLLVTASPAHGQVLEAGEDSITVTWGSNQSFSAATNESYRNVKVKLCYAPISQIDRRWRKTVDNLAKDKTCQFTVVSKPFQSINQTFEWRIESDIPTATYFVRAYAYNSNDDEVAYGQTTDTKKSNNLFEVQGMSGRPWSLDIAAICFSAFSLVSLFGFFFIEKRRNKRSEKK